MTQVSINKPITGWAVGRFGGTNGSGEVVRLVISTISEHALVIFNDLEFVNNTKKRAEFTIDIYDVPGGDLLFTWKPFGDDLHRRRIEPGAIVSITADWTEEEWVRKYMPMKSAYEHMMEANERASAEAAKQQAFMDQNQSIDGLTFSPSPELQNYLTSFNEAFKTGLANLANFMHSTKEAPVPNITDEQRAADIKAAADKFNNLVQEAAATGLRTDIDLFPINRVGTQPYSIVKTEVVRIIGVAPETGKLNVDVNNG